MKLNKQVPVVTSVTLSQLVELLSSLEREEIINLIAEVEKRICDWDFTQELALSLVDLMLYNSDFQSEDFDPVLKQQIQLLHSKLYMK